MFGVPMVCSALDRPEGSRAAGGLTRLTTGAGRVDGATFGSLWVGTTGVAVPIGGAPSRQGDSCHRQKRVSSMSSHALQWPSFASANTTVFVPFSSDDEVETEGVEVATGVGDVGIGAASPPGLSICDLRRGDGNGGNGDADKKDDKDKKKK